MFDTFNTKGLAGRSANSLYTRRRLLATAAGFAAVSMLPASGALANVKSLAKHRVLIVGAGVGGATAARYLKMWQPDADVTIIERNPVFIRHYGSSEHLTGAVSMADLTVSYEGLRAHGVKIVQGVAQALDPVRKEVGATVNGSVQKFGYDSLIVSPGVELFYDKIEGYSAQRFPRAGLRAYRPRSCADSFLPCPTAAPLCSLRPRIRTAARRGHTSAAL